MGRASRMKADRRRARERLRAAEMLEMILDGPDGYRDRWQRYQASGNAADLLPAEVNCQAGGKVHIGWFRHGGALFPACSTVTGPLEVTDAEVSCKRCLATSETQRSLFRSFGAALEGALISHYHEKLRGCDDVDG